MIKKSSCHVTLKSTAHSDSPQQVTSHLIKASSRTPDGNSFNSNDKQYSCSFYSIFKDKQYEFPEPFLYKLLNIEEMENDNVPVNNFMSSLIQRMKGENE